MKREVRHLYRVLLRPGKVLSITKMIDMYREWEEFRKVIGFTEEASSAMRNFFMPELVAPKYIEWVKQYLVEEQK